MAAGTADDFVIYDETHYGIERIRIRRRGRPETVMRRGVTMTMKRYRWRRELKHPLIKRGR